MQLRSEIYSKLGNFVAVKNMFGSSGREVPNQFVISFENGRIYQSYKSVIVVELFRSNKYYLGGHWNYSRTTAKYRNLFLNKIKAEIENDIKGGQAIICYDL